MAPGQGTVQQRGFVVPQVPVARSQNGHPSQLPAGRSEQTVAGPPRATDAPATDAPLSAARPPWSPEPTPLAAPAVRRTAPPTAAGRLTRVPRGPLPVGVTPYPVRASPSAASRRPASEAALSDGAQPLPPNASESISTERFPARRLRQGQPTQVGVPAPPYTPEIRRAFRPRDPGETWIVRLSTTSESTLNPRPGIQRLPSPAQTTHSTGLTPPQLRGHTLPRHHPTGFPRASPGEPSAGPQGPWFQAHSCGPWTPRTSAWKSEPRNREGAELRRGGRPSGNLGQHPMEGVADADSCRPAGPRPSSCWVPGCLSGFLIAPYRLPDGGVKQDAKRVCGKTASSRVVIRRPFFDREGRCNLGTPHKTAFVDDRA